MIEQRENTAKSASSEGAHKFVLVGTQRSGTTLVQTALDSHPDILCEGELFHMRRLFREIPKENYGEPGYRWWLGRRLDRWAGHAMWRHAVVREYLEWFISMHQSPALGFKLMWNQTGRFPEALSFVRRNNFLLLHVRRRNSLRSLVSRFAAGARGIHHSTEKVSTPRVTVPVDRLLPILQTISVENDNWKKLGNELPYLCVDYEDYVVDTQIENRRMLNFLGVSADIPIQSPLVKLTPNNLRDVIANYEAVERALSGTVYEEMLEE